MEDNFLIYRASAGTGKTFSLVKEYLSLILKKPDGFKHTLAITFTNKASGEMKSRILFHLKNIAAGENPDNETWQSMVPELQQATGLSKEVLILNAELALSQILHNYAVFSVGTIDSFSNVVVQSFAREMQLPTNYELELNSDNIIAKAVDVVVSQAGDDHLITDILIRFVKQQIENSKHTNIVLELNSFAKKMLDEDGTSQRNKLAEFNSNTLLEKELQIKEILQSYKAEIYQTALSVWKSIQHLERAFFQGAKGIPGFFRKLVKDPFLFQESIYAEKTINENRWFAGKATVSEKNEIDNLRPFIEESYAKIRDLQETNKTKIILFSLIQRNLHSMMLLNEIHRTIIAQRDESGMVHISELNKKIAEIIGKDPVPFIYERIGQRYKNYLIDEFQDTSVLQWNNFIPLVLNSLSENGFSMIVGDGKQAIYRWRNGDVEQFERLSALNEQDVEDEIETTFKQHLKLQRLQQNFRSDKTIVEFNNKLFEFAKRYLPPDYEELKNVYSDLQLDALPKKPDGFVSLRFIQQGEDQKAYQKAMCEAVSAQIKELISRGIENREIAVLCRSNKSSIMLAQHLMQENISVASSDSLMLTASKTVTLIVSVLYYLAVSDPSNTAILWMQLFKNKYVAWSDDVMEQIKSINRINFQKILETSGYIVDFEEIEKMTLLDAAIELVTLFKLNKKHDLHLRFFLDALLEAQGENILTINDFPKWWEEKGKNQALLISEDTDAVKVMTIHKSKGLGFPVVIYAFADEAFKKSNENIWIDLNEEEYFFPAALLPLNKDLTATDFAKYYHEEEAKSVLDLLNVLYVACTRPKKELYILSQCKKNFQGEKCDIPDILQSFLVSEGEWKEEKLEYSFGTLAQTTEKKASKLAETTENDDISIIPWNDRISITSRARNFWNVEKTNYGNLIHSLLEKIKTASALKPVLHQALLAGVFLNKEMPEIEQILQKVVYHPELQSFFDSENEILTEASILLPKHGEMRPDRIAISGKKVYLLDYKTGKKTSEHVSQLQKYARELERMGYEVADKKIVYLTNNVIDIENIA